MTPDETNQMIEEIVQAKIALMERRGVMYDWVAHVLIHGHMRNADLLTDAQSKPLIKMSNEELKAEHKEYVK